MINIIITMAGLGTRFKTKGFTGPKYKIKAGDKTLFGLSMSSLKGYVNEETRIIFVALKENNDVTFISSECTKLGFTKYKIVELDQVTDGQATTCMAAIELCNPDDPILIYNIDTYVEPFYMRIDNINGDGFIPCFIAEGDHWSFVNLDSSGKATEVVEKKRISEYCSIGAYYFRSAKLFRDAYFELYGDGIQNGEKYIAPMYNVLIKKGYDVRIEVIDYNRVHPLGTPEELEIFLRDMDR